MRIGRADQDIVKPVAVDVAQSRNGAAAGIERCGAVDADPVAACRGSEGHVREPAGLAEDDVSGPFCVRAVVLRRDHDVAESVAVEVPCGRDCKAGLRSAKRAHDIGGKDDAESLGWMQGLGVDGGSPQGVLARAAENHVGGVVRVPRRERFARCTDDDISQAIAVDIAGGRHGRAGVVAR